MHKCINTYILIFFTFIWKTRSRHHESEKLSNGYQSLETVWGERYEQSADGGYSTATV